MQNGCIAFVALARTVSVYTVPGVEWRVKVWRRVAASPPVLPHAHTPPPPAAGAGGGKKGYGGWPLSKLLSIDGRPRAHSVMMDHALLKTEESMTKFRDDFLCAFPPCICSMVRKKRLVRWLRKRKKLSLFSFARDTNIGGRTVMCGRRKKRHGKKQKEVAAEDIFPHLLLQWSNRIL